MKLVWEFEGETYWMTDNVLYRFGEDDELIPIMTTPAFYPWEDFKEGEDDGETLPT